MNLVSAKAPWVKNVGSYSCYKLRQRAATAMEHMVHVFARPCLIFYHLLLRDDPLVATLEVGQLVRGVEKHACGKDSYQLNCSRKKKP